MRKYRIVQNGLGKYTIQAARDGVAVINGLWENLYENFDNYKEAEDRALNLVQIEKEQELAKTYTVIKEF